MYSTCTYIPIPCIDCSDYNKNFICHSGFQQGGAQECTDTQYSLLLNGTNRELRMSNFNLLNDTFQKGDNIPNNCQPQSMMCIIYIAIYCK